MQAFYVLCHKILFSWGWQDELPPPSLVDLDRQVVLGEGDEVLQDHRPLEGAAHLMDYVVAATNRKRNLDEGKLSGNSCLMFEISG